MAYLRSQYYRMRCRMACLQRRILERKLAYAISFNGKARFSMELPADMPREEIEKAALAHENSAKWMEGKTPKKIIVVPGKIVNIVI